MGIYDKNRTKKDVDEFIQNHISDKMYSYHKRGEIISWKNWKQRAKLTESLDYGCNFKNGSCRTKTWTHEKPTKPNMCCCVGCAANFGYLADICKDDVETYKSLFNLKTGFWREGKGCILPRELRSCTCLSYRCYDNDNPEKTTNLDNAIHFILGGTLR